MPVIMPAFSFERCPHCGEPKTILEAMYLDRCEDCETTAWLDRERAGLYEKLGLTFSTN